jgi:hypothetical protein
MSGGYVNFNTLDPAARRSVRAAADAVWVDLFEAACRARAEGWHIGSGGHETDPIYAEAKRLKVWVWKALADRIARAARDEVAAP